VAEPAVFEPHYAYPFASGIARVGGRSRLALAASNSPGAERLFFAGALLKPEIAAALLLATSEVALRRYYIPPNMLASMRSADPVVTVADGRLRFEAFSQCCSVYARADFLPGMLSPEICGKGTTNVDFNAQMRAALSHTRARDHLDLRVTSQQMAVSTSRGTTVERKVKLPIRWLKGFAEVQALATTLVHAATLAGPIARRFLSALPREVKAKDQVWLVPSAHGLRASQQASTNAIPSAGLGRLQAMKPIARYADSLRIYAGAHGTSAFELDFGVARYMLVLSAAAARGFSGEGQVLTALGRHTSDEALARVRATLAWQSEIRTADLARTMNLPEAAVISALSLLAAQGLVGVDPREGAYFHRELPFDLSRIDGLYPRLKDARALNDGGSVMLTAHVDGAVNATVRGPDLEHRVRLAGDDYHCTCIWHARTGGHSGPCKHVLAVMMASPNASGPG
jgi:hypothetical protein